MSNNNSEFKNFAVLTAEVSGVELKESASGNKYKTAKATLTGITYEGEDGTQYHPVIEILAFKKAKKYLKPGPKLLMGSLSYSEYEDDDEEIVRRVKLIANSIKPRKEGDQERNFAHLSLRIGKNAETRISQKTGDAWASVRAALSMGKDEDGDYRPSLWLTLKAFTRNGDDEFVYEVGDLQKGDHIHVKGGLTVDEYQGRLYWGMFLNTNGFEFRNFDNVGDDKADKEEVNEDIEELEAIPD